MAKLLGAVDHQVHTDFHMLGATQDPRGIERPMSWNYATSVPGAVSVVCGFKSALASIRLERWDGRPEDVPDQWEDVDEVPFAAVDGTGPLRPYGFDPPDSDGLDVEELGRARLRVLARGRYRYARGSRPPDGAPEAWLMQLWPDPDTRDALTGPPRRLAGPPPFDARPKPWTATERQWQYTGWTHLLGGIPTAHQIPQALARPRRLDNISVLVRPDPTAAATLVLATPEAPLGSLATDPGEWRGLPVLDHLAAAVGAPVETFGDLVAALEQIGLIARMADGRHTLVPFVPVAWEVLDLPSDLVRRLRRFSDLHEFRTIPDDLLHLLVWAPDKMLVATPTQMAVRLALRVDDVLGGLRVLESDTASGRLHTDRDLRDIAPHDRLTLHLADP